MGFTVPVACAAANIIHLPKGIYAQAELQLQLLYAACLLQLMLVLQAWAEGVSCTGNTSDCSAAAAAGKREQGPLLYSVH